jgi:DNA polymerase-3 subunit delta'
MNPPPWQQHYWTQLHHYIDQRRIPQALLISGRNGLGKQQVAKQFANALLCKQPDGTGVACGHCASCLLFAADTHPDFMVLQPEEDGKSITIEQIRALITRLTLKPQFEQYRVVIVSPADAMNIKSANAFLKCLEEPAERTVIILMTDKPAKLPATIMSRCQKLVMAAPDAASLRAWLKQQQPAIADAELPVLLAMAQESPLLALEYAKNGVLSLRNGCFEAWQALAKHQTHPVIVAEGWQKLPESAVLFWVSSWVMDLIKCGYRLDPDTLSNPDLAQPLQALSPPLDLKKLYGLYDLLLRCRQRLDTPVNKQVLFEEILIYWSELNPRR